MEKLWKIAITISGLGGIGAFVFWSLYKEWLTLPIFAKMSPIHTFILMLTFLIFTFFSLLVILFVHVKLKKNEIFYKKKMKSKNEYQGKMIYL